MKELKFETLRFIDVKNIWSNKLWPKRQSEIEEISFINHSGLIDMSVRDWASPVFLGLRKKGQLIAVTSYFQSSQDHWRLRGTWVDESFRRQSIGRVLISEVVRSIVLRQENGCIWTMARFNSASFYTKNNFKVEKQVNGYEYGPHLIMKYGG